MSFYVIEIGSTEPMGPFQNEKAVAALGPIGRTQADRIVAGLKSAGRSAKRVPEFPFCLLATRLPRIDMRDVTIASDESTEFGYPKARTAVRPDGTWIHAGDLYKVLKNEGLLREVTRTFAKALERLPCTCVECSAHELGAACLALLTIGSGLKLSDIVNGSGPQPVKTAASEPEKPATEQPAKPLEEALQNAMPELEKQLAEGGAEPHHPALARPDPARAQRLA